MKHFKNMIEKSKYLQILYEISKDFYCIMFGLVSEIPKKSHISYKNNL